MIVSCPSCGTNYKRPASVRQARARCGCCAGTIDLHALKPYRIARGESRAGDLGRAGAHLAIGLDDPALAGQIAARAGGAAPWDETESLPEIPEMASGAPEFARTENETAEAERAIAESTPDGGSPLVVYGFWAVGGAIVGTGTSWTLGGTTETGLAAGGLCGLAAAWGWLRWASRP